MRLNPQAVINSRWGVGAVLALSRAMPPRLGYRLTDLAGNWISHRQDWSLVQAVRANQWVVHQGRLSAEELDEAVRGVFRHTARCLYDLYHNLHNPAAAQALLQVSPALRDLIEHSQASEEGLIVVGVHLSNFDFVMQAAGLLGLRAQAISVPNPGGGYQWQNDLREQTGIHITPASKEALRQAAERLRAGGLVISGLDRPVPGGQYRPKFFGRPASVPVLHVPLALKTGAPVVVVATIMNPEGIYEVLVSDRVYLQHYPNRRQEIIENAERVLSVAADFICQAPNQWSMTHPLWPEAVAELAVGRP